MGAEVTSQGVSPTAGVVTVGAFERLLSRMQLGVAQQVPLLREGGATRLTLERALTCRPARGHTGHRFLFKGIKEFVLLAGDKE